MNTGFDLDTLRGRWGALDRPLDATLDFDLAALRTSLSQRMRSAFRRHSHWLVAALVFDAIALLALLAFGIAHRNVPVYLASAIALGLVAWMEAATDIHAWRSLRTLDFDAPVLAVRERLAALRARRLRTTGAVILFSIPLWIPFLAVSIEGLFGGDLFAVLHWSVSVGNIVFGLLFVPVAVWISRMLARRLRGNAGFEQFLDDAAGKSWSAASTRWATYAETEERIARGEAASLLPAQLGRDALAHEVAAPLRALRRVLWLGIVLAVVPMLAIAAFNAGHGGQARFLVPGLMLHFFLLVHMVANIAHLHAVRRLDVGSPPQRLSTTIAWMASQRERLARWTLVALPLFVLPAALVIGTAWFDIDLLAPLSGAVQASLAAIALIASIGLFLIRARIATALLDAICTGCLQRSRALIAAIDAAAERDSG